MRKAWNCTIFPVYQTAVVLKGAAQTRFYTDRAVAENVAMILTGMGGEVHITDRKVLCLELADDEGLDLVHYLLDQTQSSKPIKVESWQDANKWATKRLEALAKLTDEDKAVLGLK